VINPDTGLSPVVYDPPTDEKTGHHGLDESWKRWLHDSGEEHVWVYLVYTRDNHINASYWFGTKLLWENAK